MERQYDDHIVDLTLKSPHGVVTGKATADMPRWTHVRPR